MQTKSTGDPLLKDKYVNFVPPGQLKKKKPFAPPGLVKQGRAAPGGTSLPQAPDQASVTKAAIAQRINGPVGQGPVKMEKNLPAQQSLSNDAARQVQQGQPGVPGKGRALGHYKNKNKGRPLLTGRANAIQRGQGRKLGLKRRAGFRP
jgi:hypothetical protein